jgi:hypothetical protein
VSDIPADWRGQLDLRAEIARIDRDRAESEKLRQETEKFVAEQRKLIAESSKFASEQQKLFAESQKLNRDRWLAPVLAVVTVLGGLLGAATFIAHLMGH